MLILLKSARLLFDPNETSDLKRSRRLCFAKYTSLIFPLYNRINFGSTAKRNSRIDFTRSTLPGDFCQTTESNTVITIILHSEMPAVQRSERFRCTFNGTDLQACYAYITMDKYTAFKVTERGGEGRVKEKGRKMSKSL